MLGLKLNHVTKRGHRGQRAGKSLPVSLPIRALTYTQFEWSVNRVDWYDDLETNGLRAKIQTDVDQPKMVHWYVTPSFTLQHDLLWWSMNGWDALTLHQIICPLIHMPLATPYGVIEINQHWFMRVPDGTRLLAESILTYDQLGSSAFCWDRVCSTNSG